MIQPQDNLHKVLNPNQRQILEDERRMEKKIKLLNEGKTFNLLKC